MSGRLVYIVEHDASVRQALARLVDAARLESRPCATIDTFLQAPPEPNAACAVLDLAGLRRSDPGVRSRLRERAVTLPVIALAVGDDAATRRLAREIGAQAFFRIPVDGAALLDSIDWVSGPDAEPAQG